MVKRNKSSTPQRSPIKKAQPHRTPRGGGKAKQRRTRNEEETMEFEETDEPTDVHVGSGTNPTDPPVPVNVSMKNQFNVLAQEIDEMSAAVDLSDTSLVLTNDTAKLVEKLDALNSGVTGRPSGIQKLTAEDMSTDDNGAWQTVKARNRKAAEHTAQLKEALTADADDEDFDPLNDSNETDEEAVADERLTAYEIQRLKSDLEDDPRIHILTDDQIKHMDTEDDLEYTDLDQHIPKLPWDDPSKTMAMIDAENHRQKHLAVSDRKTPTPTPALNPAPTQAPPPASNATKVAALPEGPAPSTPGPPPEMDEDGLPKLGSPYNDPLEKTYVEAAQGSAADFTPPPIDTNRSIRYRLRIEAPPQKFDSLVKSVCTSLRTVLQMVQQMAGPKIGIGLWDPQASTKAPFTRPEDIPSGKDVASKLKKVLKEYFDHWARFSANKKFVGYFKVRFITSEPDSLQFPLTHIGENLHEDLKALHKDPTKDPLITLSRNPLACQATNTVVVGWLFGSVKNINENVLIPAARRELGLPDYIAFGIMWRTLWTVNKKTYPWNNEDKPPQALVIEMDKTYYPVYEPKMAALWKKRPKGKVLGMQLRLVPAFTSPNMETADDETKADMVAMMEKQKHFINHHVTTIDSSFIARLDFKIMDKQGGAWTLRRYLMNKAPHGMPTQRLFVSLDLKWSGDGHVLTTVQPFRDQAITAHNNMIPECFWLFGEQVSAWFSDTGKHLFREVIWDPDSNKTKSLHNPLAEVVKENFYGMGQTWQPKPVTGRGIVEQTPATTPSPTEPPAALTTSTATVAPLPSSSHAHTAAGAEAPNSILKPTSFLNPDKKQVTVRDVLDQRAISGDGRGDASVKSFGDLYGREHDGDTVRTAKPATNTSSEEEDDQEPTTNPRCLRFDLSGMELQAKDNSGDDASKMTTSTAARTTDSTRVQLKTVKRANAQLAEENEHQARELEFAAKSNDLLRNQLEEMARRLAMLEASSTPARPNAPAQATITPQTQDPKASSVVEGADLAVAEATGDSGSP